MEQRQRQISGSADGHFDRRAESDYIGIADTASPIVDHQTSSCEGSIRATYALATFLIILDQVFNVLLRKKNPQQCASHRKKSQIINLFTCTLVFLMFADSLILVRFWDA